MSKNEKYLDVCCGIMTPDEKEKISIPPRNCCRFKFQDENCMVIPLEGAKQKNGEKPQKKETNQARKTKVNNKEETGRDV